VNVDFLYGILNLSFWQYVLVTFLMVQVTFMGVTLYLHRDATHRSLDLHPALRHVFRFWLWMSLSTTGWRVARRAVRHYNWIAPDTCTNPASTGWGPATGPRISHNWHKN
jgi:fatty-acid desaturase